MNREMPLSEKYLLTIQEAAIYFHLGEKKLRQLIDEHTDANYFLMNGNRALIKRRLFEEFLDEVSVV